MADAPGCTGGEARLGPVLYAANGSGIVDPTVVPTEEG
jgi:hypothetical protein